MSREGVINEVKNWKGLVRQQKWLDDFGEKRFQ